MIYLFLLVRIQGIRVRVFSFFLNNPHETPIPEIARALNSVHSQYART
jgi:hypothetical protein